MKRRFALILVSPMALACERIDSNDVRTAGVQPIIEAIAAGNGKISVSAELRMGGVLSNNFLDLAEGDQLLVTSGGDERAMTRNVSLLNQVYYTVDLDGDEENKSIEISFVRTEDESAPSSTVTMPASLAMTAPEPGLAWLGGTDDLEIAWDNSGKEDTLTLSIRGDCIKAHQEELEDDGVHRVPANTLTLEEGMEEGMADGCEISVTLERHRKGTLDPAFDQAGTIQAVVTRQVVLTFTP